MRLLLSPARLHGAVTPPPSKSQAHRLLIAAALAGGGHIANLAASEDIAATERCLAALFDGSDRLPRLDCGESGSTLRFLIPLALALRGGGVFTGRGRLMERPQGPYFDLFTRQGIKWDLADGVLTVQGKLKSGRFELPGDVSSQFVTGLLYALPLLDGNSEIVLTTPLESSGYVDMTLDALTAFGVNAEERPPGRAGACPRRVPSYRVPGSQQYRPADVTVEADYSQAAFYCTANGLGNAVTIEGLNPESRQGDRVISSYSEALCGAGEVTLDVSQCPDLVPALALHAALRNGETTRIVGAARLRMKESDRLETTATQLNALGADITQTADSLIVRGVSTLTGGAVSGCGDHRIAMMLGIAATRATGDVLLEGAECVAKSYPNFWAHYAALGGKYKEVGG